MNEDKVEPIKVFISSSQKEFERLRKNLKTEIDDVELAYQKMLRAILVESKKGTSIQSDIDEGLSDSAIYVGIFGQVYSEITVEEFRKAYSRMMPVLIYRFRKNKRIKSVIRGRSNVDEFLRAEVKQYDIRIRGPFSNETALIEAVITDLGFLIAKMVKESANIRRTIGR
ncbi:DUF4062 domain-containing protein [Nitrososphaera sp.]|uniref:DUF4062 domain-containing protein n=1 Tax=Nitrososphaera sp. TaxID=1971748 RepID=UPI001818CD9F|nr:DUF4062 domain-containing protein [Nitrososphaera sp.]NWG37050.1 DUF4062 domain-containing protein [Nitrososphaera sp.]